tara:strand:- start:164 stop:304 length:141 start_codon:yes stop_codon:yes gene_type:complete
MKNWNWLNKKTDDPLFTEWIEKMDKELIKRLRIQKQKRAIQRKKDL